MRRVILDTDIGSDVDDALALVQVLGSPALDLVGVTTAYGDTALRAQLAARIARVAGRSITICAGAGTPLSGRTVWWAGHEGILHEHLDTESFNPQSATEFMVREVIAAPKQIDVVSIAPLTNIATAILTDRRFADSVRHLWMMGGAFASAEPEHNFRSDVTAARVVLSAGIPTTIAGLEVTRKVTIDRALLSRVQAAGPLGKLLQGEIEQWWRFWNAEWNVPHDPVCVLSLTESQHFTFSGLGTVTLDEDGRSTFIEGEGDTRIVRDVAATTAAERIVHAIVAAGRAVPLGRILSGHTSVMCLPVDPQRPSFGAEE